MDCLPIGIHRAKLCHRLHCKLYLVSLLFNMQSLFVALLLKFFVFIFQIVNLIKQLVKLQKATNKTQNVTKKLKVPHIIKSNVEFQSFKIKKTWGGLRLEGGGGWVVRGKGLKYDSFMLTSRWAYNRRGLLRFCILQLEGGGGRWRGAYEQQFTEPKN